MSTTASAFFALSAKSGRPAAARWTNSAIDGDSISTDGDAGGPAAGSGSGGTGKLVLAVDAQHDAAGDEHGERRARVQQLAHEARGGGHLLEVVDQQQRPAHAAQVLDDGRHERALTGLAQAERRGDRRRPRGRGSAIGARLTNATPPSNVGASSRGHLRAPAASSRYLPGRSASSGARRAAAACAATVVDLRGPAHGAACAAAAAPAAAARGGRRRTAVPPSRPAMPPRRRAARFRPRRPTDGRSPASPASGATGARTAPAGRAASPRRLGVSRDGDGVEHAERRSRFEWMRRRWPARTAPRRARRRRSACPRSRRVPAPATCSAACRG